ncbi:ribosome biogenesis protein tsr1, putative [Entamoeba invadens IP1]|uniref:Ribosome biogenesis protein tsr1, putative n=1 Tax=Entamoeba invadens IP1 TaxID=370355 RepID=A0A0A1TZD6_ENTIV|nr:ribosome biogenesis protein tsr1, putative [Entamoeba invadens IP1]ELP86955.1 ribosome biogenesis protein tsr1, putative [Entamoeba invadens IP1]|eukprot:XP_004253726.1 ribosome biogenesis protein tsr1, putative [Entamoeba invadens IP1]
MNTHRSGELSQTNKPFQRRGGSKRQQKKKGKKKSEVVKTRPVFQDPKEVRKAQIRQRQKGSRERQQDLLRKERQGLGAPRTIGFLGLGDADVQTVLKTLRANWTEEAVVGDITYVKTQFRRLAIWAPQNDIWNRMDAAKIADIMVVVMGNNVSGDEEEKLDYLVAQGLGDVMLVGEKAKLKKGRWSGYRVYDPATEGPRFIQILCTMSTKEKMDGPGYFVIDKEELDGDNVKVKGYVRRSDLSRLNRGYIIGVGDVDVLKIGNAVDPYGVGEDNIDAYTIQEDEDEEENEEKSDRAMSEEDEEKNAAPSKPVEQTGVFKITKNVPVGAGSYTAAWIVGDDNMNHEMVEEVKDSDDDDDDVNVDAAMDCEYEEEAEEDVDPNETEEDRINRRCAKYKENPDKYRVKKGESAKEHFKGYRGLRSLRQTEWDCDEDLPGSYNDIIQFENFRVISDSSRYVDDGVEEGTYVELLISNLKVGSLIGKVFCSLRQYEDKESIVHVLFHVENDSLPLESGKSYRIQLGDRRYFRNITFTDTDPMGGKYREVKWAVPGSSVIGSFYGFITFRPSSALLFATFDGREELVATGTLDSVDPSRVIIERSILTGVPIKIGRHKVTVRGMFSVPADAKWFKPIELLTAQGIAGTILCSLGEHGLIKCTFEKQLKSNDVVTMSLYRRVFPIPPEPQQLTN